MRLHTFLLFDINTHLCANYSSDVLTFSFRENDSLISHSDGFQNEKSSSERRKTTCKSLKVQIWRDKLSSPECLRRKNHRPEFVGGLCNLSPSLLSSGDLRATGGSQLLIWVCLQRRGARWVIHLNKCTVKKHVKPWWLSEGTRTFQSLRHWLGLLHSFLATYRVEKISAWWVWSNKNVTYPVWIQKTQQAMLYMPVRGAHKCTLSDPLMTCCSTSKLS